RVSKRTQLDEALLGTGFPFRDLQSLEEYLAMFREFTLRTAGQRRAGAAALDIAYVAAGRLDGFWEMGLSPWDMAAGARLFREGAFEEAERAAAECAKWSSDLAELHSLRASIALAQGRNESAALHFTRTLEVLPPSDPTRARTMLRLAAALQDCNRQREA